MRRARARIFRSHHTDVVRRTGMRAAVLASLLPRRSAVLALIAAVHAGPLALAQEMIERVEVVPVTPGAPGPLQTYRAGQTFALWFTYSGVLPVVGPGVTAQILLGPEAGAERTVYTSDCRSEGRSLVCPYTVTSTDEDPDGVRIPEDGIREAGESVLPTRRYSGDLDGVEETLDNHKVDGVSVGLTNDMTLVVTSAPGPGRTVYRAGEVVRATLGFTEPVADFGRFAPQLLPGIPMTAVGGSEQQRHFTYVVRPGDNATALRVAGLSRPEDVVDVHGNRGIHHEGRPLVAADVKVAYDPVAYDAAALGPQAIDTRPPSVVDVRLAGGRTLLGRQDVVDIIVSFDEAVVLRGTASPLLRLRIGRVWKRIPLFRDPGGAQMNELTFRLAPASETERLDGDLGVPPNALVAVSADGTAISDAAGNPAGNTPGGFETLGAQIDWTPPSVASISMPSRGTAARIGTVLGFGVTFDEAVVIAPDAPPLLRFRFGGGADREARFVDHSTRTVRFGYTLRASDLERRSSVVVGIPEQGALGAATRVTDAAGNPVEVAAYPAPADVEIAVAEDTDDTTRPTLVAVTTDRTLYGMSPDTIRIMLRFSEDVVLKDHGGRMPRFNFRIGERAAVAEYVDPGTRPACGGPTVCFVHDHGNVAGAVRWRANALDDSAVIEDLAGNAWSGGIRAGGRARVDPVPPTVSSVDIISRPRNRQPGGSGTDLYYGDGDRVVVELRASESVHVGSEAALELGIGGTTGTGCSEPTTVRSAVYRSGNGTAQLTFEYRVRATDVDIDGITVCHAVGIEDAAGNALTSAPGDVYLHDAGAHPVDGRLRPGTGETPTTPVDPDGGSSEVGARAVLVSEGTGTDGSHIERDTVVLRVEFDAPGADIRTPLTLELDIGGRLQTVACAGLGTGRRFVECSYRVRSGDEDRDGVFVQIVSGAVHAGGVEITPDLSALDPPALRIDTNVPEVLSVEWSTDPGPDETYAAGDVIGVDVSFSEPVRGDGSVTLPLRFGSTLRRATLSSPGAGVAAARYEFRYTVAPGDDDANGAAVPALTPGSLVGSLRDGAGHEAVLAHPEVADDPAHRVDTRRPAVTTFSIARVAPAGRAVFGVGDTVSVVAWFDEPVAVGSTGATLSITVGGAAVEARYVVGSGSASLTFEYDVAPGDNGELGVAVDALGGGVADIGGNPVEGNAAMSLDATVDTVSPSIGGGPQLLSTPTDGVYGIGDEIVVALPFTERVVVSAGRNGPRLRIGIGTAVRHAAYASGSGTDTIRFAYRVAAGDVGERVSVPANALEVADGAIRDANGIDAAVGHAGMPVVDGHRVDGVAPQVAAVAIVSNPANTEAYLPGEDIVVEVRFSEPVLASGDVTLAIAVGEGMRGASCAARGEADILACTYTVVVGDFDEDGIAVPADALAGAATDAAGNTAALGIEALADDPGHPVHAAPPDLAGDLAAVTLVAGGAATTLDLGTLFRGHRPLFGARVTDEAVATALVTGATLTLRSGIEGTATVTITATNAAGALDASFMVEVVTDPVEKRVLEDAFAAVGRSMLAATTAGITARFDLAREGPGLSFGGREVTPVSRLAGGTGIDGAVPEPRGALNRSAAGSGGLPVAGPGFRPSLAGTGFDFNLAAPSLRGMRLSIWGSGDLQSVSGSLDGGDFDGTATTGLLGVDARGETVLAGVALSVSAANLNYGYQGETAGGGDLETTVTGLHPYAHLRISDDTEVWAVGGFGAGDAVAVRPHVARTEETPIDMAMAVAGLRRSLAFRVGSTALAIRGDAGFLSLGGDEGNRAVDGLSVAVARVRVALEGSWQFGGVVPFATVGTRFDGGDGNARGGIELAGGVRISGAHSAFALEAKGRVLAVPFGDEAGDGGVSVAATYEPSRTGRGFWFRVSPHWGAAATPMDPFGPGWHDHLSGGRAFLGGRDWRMDATVGYGFELRGPGGVLTPFAEARDTAAGAGGFRGGLRYRGVGGHRPVDVEFAVAQRPHPSLPGAQPVVTLQARL